MVKNNQEKKNPLSIIVDGVSKLFETNKNLGWFLVIISILTSIQNLAYRSDYNAAQNDLSATYNIGEAEIAWFAVFFLIFFIPFGLAMAAIFVYIHGMISYAALQSVKGKSPSIKECFDATKAKFWTLLGVAIIIFFKVLGGLILFIIPGIRAASRYYITGFVVFDKNLSAGETVKYTKEITKGRLLTPFLTMLASGIISPIGYLIQYGGMVGMYPTLKDDSKGQKA